MSKELPSVLAASSSTRLAVARAAVAKYVMPDPEDPARLAIYCPNYAAIYAAKPADPVFKVLKAPSNAVPIGTRSVYDLVRGTPFVFHVHAGREVIADQHHRQSRPRLASRHAQGDLGLEVVQQVLGDAFAIEEPGRWEAGRGSRHADQQGC